jgi:hypothetical protein
MPQSQLAYVALASIGPIAASAAQTPELIFEGGAAGVLGAVGLALWRLGNGVLEQMKLAEKHRDAQSRQWEAYAEHRRAEREHWRVVQSSRSGT